MQPVQLVEREQVDQSLDLRDAEEVPRDVEHHPAPREPRPVVDRDDGDRATARAAAVRVDRRREQLPERLGAAVEARGRAGSEQDATGLDRQPVALVAERAVGGPQGERDVPVRRRAADGRHGQAEPRRRTQASRRGVVRRVGPRRPRDRGRSARAASARTRLSRAQPREAWGRSRETPAPGQPRTAPDVRLNMIFRWTSRKKTITGIAVSVDAAISAPQSVLRLVP